MSQTELGRRVAARRPNWSRSAVVKLENYSRESVSVADVLALALALDVPPALLIADPRQPGRVPVAEGVERDQWDALLWIIGTGTIDAEASGRTFSDGAWLIQAGTHVVEALGDLDRVERGESPEDSQARTERRHAVALRQLSNALLRIQAQGAPPPRLPARVLKRAAELDIELPGVEDE